MNNKKTDIKKKVSIHLQHRDSCIGCPYKGYLKLNSEHDIGKISMCLINGGTAPKNMIPSVKCKANQGHDVQILEVLFGIFNIERYQLNLFTDDEKN